MKHVKFYIYYNQSTFYGEEGTHTRTHMHTQVRTSTPYRSALNFILGFPFWMLVLVLCGSVVFLLPSLLSLLIPFVVPSSLFVHSYYVNNFIFSSLDARTFRSVAHSFFLSPPIFNTQSWIVCHFVFFLFFLLESFVVALLNMSV